MSEPVVVFRTHSDIEASVVRALLDSHGIHAFVTSDAPHAILPLAVNGLGEVRVSVPAAEAETARRVIAASLTPRPAPEVVPFREPHPLEERLGYRFRRRDLLEQALTHRSRAHEEAGRAVADNESLEFLGDAVLGFIVADLLYHELPDADEGTKSKVKAALVSRATLARMGEALAVGEALRLGRGEEKSGGRRKDALVADACEAIIAALYLDGGLDVARRVVVEALAPLLSSMGQPGGLTALTGDYKSALQERLHAAGEAPPEYRVVAERGPEHRKQFEVEVWAGGRLLARASGRSKKEAEQGAAGRALAALDAAAE
jgi:ribonuclease-3